jgi:hypothetical protein
MTAGRKRSAVRRFLKLGDVLEVLLGAAVLRGKDGLLLDLGEMLHGDVSVDAGGEAAAALLNVLGIGLDLGGGGGTAPLERGRRKLPGCAPVG